LYGFVLPSQEGSLSKWKKLRASPFLALDVALAPSQILSPAGEMHGFFHETYFNGKSYAHRLPLFRLSILRRF
jgi:hypothetical protein